MKVKRQLLAVSFSLSTVWVPETELSGLRLGGNALYWLGHFTSRSALL